MNHRQVGPPVPLAVTMGCPAGIGPEIIVKVLASSTSPPAVVFGDKDILERACAFTGIGDITFEKWSPGQDISCSAQGKTIFVYPLTSLSPEEIIPGTPSATTGRASYKYLEAAIDLALEKKVSAIVTAPLSKTGLRLAGYRWPGHTEILAKKTQTRDFVMMMAGSKLVVTLVTIHVPLSQVPALLSKKRVLKTIEITYHAMKRDFGINRPKIAVCGLNPHAGEGGMFGMEETEIIGPACTEAIDHGIDVKGPLPPDTVFFQAANREFDAVVCQYHDQGLIPFKLLHFRDGVNVTIGLPIIRTSVDHGTAYDLAGTGLADPESLRSAMKLASKIHDNRSKNP